IVSSMLLVSQSWAYGGVPIPVGQTELGGTRPEYRGRGLVRTQFEVLHEWSARRGELLQVIAGVPWFYRQFGYEMALPRGGGPRVARVSGPSSRCPATSGSGATSWRAIHRAAARGSSCGCSRARAASPRGSSGTLPRPWRG